jgi:hypothetical protein
MENMPEFTETQPHLQDHPLFSGSQSVGMISGESPRWLHKLPLSQQEPIKLYGHQMLGHDLQRMGLRHEATTGKYGTPERSYIVYGASKDQLHNLANKYAQDSYIHAANGHKTAKMHFSDLADDEAGNSLRGSYIPSKGSYNFHPMQEPSDLWTHLPGKGYLRLNLDFDHPPLKDNVTKSEIREMLLVALKKAIHVYKAP